MQSKSKIYSSDLYTQELFTNRRFIINKELYNCVYNEILQATKDFISENAVLLDLGSGEGSHLKKIMHSLNKNVIGVAIDIAKPAIEMASDFLYDGILPIIADTNNLCFKDNSIDLVIDFLSPLLINETMRVLKKNGLLVKVIPNKDYLKEIRELIGETDYTKTEEVTANIASEVAIDKIISTKKTINLDEDTKWALLKMTPLTNKRDIKMFNVDKFNNITIDLSIVVIRK